MFRLDPRLRLRIPIEVTPRWEGGAPAPLEAIDLSTTGMACRGPLHLPLRTQVGVRFTLPPTAANEGKEMTLRCEAVVVNTERIGRSRAEWRTGLYFIDLRAEETGALRRFIYETLEQTKEAVMSDRGRAGSLGFAVSVGLAAALSWPSPALAYTVITHDGHRIEVKARPEVRGESAYMRLAPGGQLAVIPNDQVDWAATEKMNPARGVIAVPADATLAGREPAVRPVEIKGGPRREGPAAGEPEKAIAGSPAKGSSPGANPEALVKLQKEYAYLVTQRDQLVASRTEHEKELAALQANETAPAGGENASAKRIRELKATIESEAAQIQRLEVRMNDIRIEAVSAGGSID